MQEAYVIFGEKYWSHWVLPDRGEAQILAIVKRIQRVVSEHAHSFQSRRFQFMSMGSGADPVPELAIILCLNALFPWLVIDVTFIDPLYRHDDTRKTTMEALCNSVPVETQGRVRLMPSSKDDDANDPFPLADCIIGFNFSRDIMFPPRTTGDPDEIIKMINMSLLEIELSARQDMAEFAHRNRACKVVMHSSCTRDARQGRFVATFLPNFLVGDVAAWSLIRKKFRQQDGPQFGRRLDTNHLYDDKCTLADLVQLRQFVFSPR